MIKKFLTLVGGELIAITKEDMSNELSCLHIDIKPSFTSINPVEKTLYVVIEDENNGNQTSLYLFIQNKFYYLLMQEL